MNSKHRKTLEAVFAKPTSGMIEWVGIESLLVAIACQIIEGRGSRVRFQYSGRIVTFHRPHPAREARPYQVEDVRSYLELIGVKP